jgi:DnaJ-class molecular chaperone
MIDTIGSDEQRPGDEASPADSQTAENVCRRCGGRGRLEDAQPCPECGGTGVVIETVGDA